MKRIKEFLKKYNIFLIVIALVLIITGTSYAFINFDMNGGKINNLTTPEITLSYDESGASLNIDEVLHAGGVVYGRNDFYLLSEKWFWTMSPAGFYYNARTWRVSVNGNTGNNGVVTNGESFRPVISLDVGTLVTGTGTRENPWKIKNDNI